MGRYSALAGYISRTTQDRMIDGHKAYRGLAYALLSGCAKDKEVYVCVHMCIYTYIKRERERERERAVSR